MMAWRFPSETHVHYFRPRQKRPRTRPPQPRAHPRDRRVPGPALLLHEVDRGPGPGPEPEQGGGALPGPAPEAAAVDHRARGPTTPTSAVCCTATSSRATSCSTRRASPTSPTSVWRSGRTSSAKRSPRPTICPRSSRTRCAPTPGPSSALLPTCARAGGRGETTDHGGRRLRPGGHALRKLLTGRPPFEKKGTQDNPENFLLRVQTEEPPKPAASMLSSLPSWRPSAEVPSQGAGPTLCFGRAARDRPGEVS